jgi:hypothetical protein
VIIGDVRWQDFSLRFFQQDFLAVLAVEGNLGE